LFCGFPIFNLPMVSKHAWFFRFTRLLSLTILHTQTTGATQRRVMQQHLCLWLRWAGLVMLAFVLWAPRTAAAGQDSIISSSSLLEPPPPTPVPHTHQYNETLVCQFVDLCGTYSVLAWLCLSNCPCVAYFLRVPFLTFYAPPHPPSALSPHAKPTASPTFCPYIRFLYQSLALPLISPLFLSFPSNQVVPIAASTAVTPVLPGRPST
jgi:hypothetical protein